MVRPLHAVVAFAILAAPWGAALPLPVEVPAVLATLEPAALVDRVLGLDGVPAEARDLIRARMPAPFGPSEGEALLAHAVAKHTIVYDPGDDLEFTGDVLVDDDWRVHRNLTFRNARVTFAPGNWVIEVKAPSTLTLVDSTFEAAERPKESNAAVAARGPLLVQRSTFHGVALAVHDDASNTAALVEDSAFHGGKAGITSSRPLLEVRRSSFAALGTGISISGANRTPAAGPFVHDNVFVMDSTGISVGSQSAGLYRNNVGRANFYAVSCTGAGAHAPGDTVKHRPRFEANNLYTNYGEAISGLRGITIATPLGTVQVSSSGCDHVNPYIGPPGNGQDSTFLSSDDTMTAPSPTPHPTQAPPSPLPIRQVASSETWTGPVALDGPVVVSWPATLSLQHAALEGPYFVGAQPRAALKARDTTFDPGSLLILRNDADEALRLTLGSPDATGPLIMYRCNCTLREGVVTSKGVGVLPLGGLLTDDAAWRMEIQGTRIQGPGAGALALVVRLTMRNVVADHTAIGVFNLLATVIFEGVRFQANSIALFSLIGTVQSQTTRYEGSPIAVISVLDTLNHNQDVFAGNAIAMLPILDAAVSVSLSNFTFNAIGVFPLLAAATISSSNFVHNYLQGILVVPTPLVPSSASCSGCWAPPDESWYGDVAWAPAVAPNAVPKPSWAGKERVAQNGQVVDLAGVLEAPAIARAGGALRVANATLDLAGQHPIGAKGAGPTSGQPGRLLTDKATIRNGAFVALNTTGTLANARFERTSIVAGWNGGSYECVDLDRSGLSFLMQKGQGLAAKRILVRGSNGIAGSGIVAGQAIRVEDSAIVNPGSNGLVNRATTGDVVVARSNFWGPVNATGVRDSVKFDPNATVPPVDARENWWGVPGGPGVGGARAPHAGIAPFTTPWATVPNAPLPCAWSAVRTLPAVSLEPAVLEDTSIDPSGMGIVERTWDFGDGSAPVTTPEATVSHAFPSSGVWPVTLTMRSASGAVGSGTQQVGVLARPVPSFALHPAAPAEGTAATFLDTTTDEDGQVASRSWSCDDGFASALAAPAHAFPEAGTYLCTLTVTDDDGLQATVTQPVEVENAPPAPDFRGRLVGTKKVRFVDLSGHPGERDRDKEAWAYRWDFGHTTEAGAPATSVEREPVHVFPEESSYLVTLQVTDDDGLTSTLARWVKSLNDPPAASFRHAPARPQARVEMQFLDTSQDGDGEVLGWLWEFGDGITSVAKDPFHTYARGGDYSVTLYAMDDQGAVASVTQWVHVCETGLRGNPLALALEVCTRIQV